MKKTTIGFGLIGMTLLLTSCTDAEQARLARFDAESEILCFSGSKEPVFSDTSTGAVSTSNNGGGIYYKSKKTGKFVQLYMDCAVFEK